MNLKEIEWNDLALQPDAIRGDGSDKPLENLIQVGNPFVLNALEFYKKSKQVDAAMSLLYKENDFYYVRFPLSFRPTDKLSLDLVSVEITLQGAEEIEAYSMEPQKVEEETKIGVDAKIDSKLGISPVELSSSIGSSEEYITYQPVIEAFNLGTKTPVWEFRPTRGRSLSGIQILHLVIRQSKKSISQGIISVTGDARDKRGIFSFWGKYKKSNEDAVNFYCPIS
jgi:hypothetical protein